MIQSELMHGWIQIPAIVVIVAISETTSHNFVTLQHHSFTEIAIEPSIKTTVGSVEYGIFVLLIVFGIGHIVLIAEYDAVNVLDAEHVFMIGSAHNHHIGRCLVGGLRHCLHPCRHEQGCGYISCKFHMQ